MRCSILFALLALSLSSHAQNSVQGNIVDSLTREPVPFANVYFANTTLGTTTDKNGSFSLTGFPSGKYDLTVSFIGYHTQQQSLTFQDNSITIQISLLENATQLDEVVVSPDTTNRYYDLLEFRKNFIGQSLNARKTKIINETELDFTFDSQNRFFTAFSRKPLEIINDALGYKIVYDLHVFEIDYANSSRIYLGIPRFENLSEKIKSRWERERKRAFQGSFMHFTSSIRSGSFEGTGFEVFEFFRNPNPERPSEEYLQKKIAYWRDHQLSTSGKIVIGRSESDSLSYYISLRNLPALLDSIGQKITDATRLLNTGRDTLIYSGMLYVMYTKEPEDENYASSSRPRRPAQPRQSSVIHFLGPLILYENGYYEDVRNVFFEGYMGWAEKLSEILPLGYRPEN